MALLLPGSTADGSRQATLMGAGLLAMGTLHFVAPQGFDDAIPDWVPGDERALTYASGVAELAVGAGLLARRTRRPAALAAIVLFVAVFPANVHMVRTHRAKGTGARVATIARLPMQVPMITTAWQVFRRSGR